VAATFVTMADSPPRSTRWLLPRVRFASLVGNLVGAVVAFTYFGYVDQSLPGGMTPTAVASFVVVFAAIAVTGRLSMARWAAPLLTAPPADPVARRRVLQLPYVMAMVALAAWVVAGAVWGVGWPWLAGQLSFATAARAVFGITGIAGGVTTAFVFLVTEDLVRRALPAFFPEGGVGAIPGVVRVRVRTRLLTAFVLGGVVPLVLMGVLSYTRAAALLEGQAALASRLLDTLLLSIAFLTVVGTLAALGLAAFAARSVAGPLRALERAMKHVEDGDLTARCPAVGTDEIGTVAEGFNRMVDGLQERERIRETFGKYVTREIRDEILNGRVSLGGQAVEVTVLFSDLRDFTPWVESQEPADVVRDLNAYFSEMEEAIREHHGLVLQFIGDEIEAVFGAPVRRADHADLAVAAAVEMRRRLGAWNAARAAAGRPVLRHGIGIHTGRVLAGNIGSPERLSYALVGDAVNLASRIQDATKEAGADILLSGVTRERLATPVPLRGLPALRVKGKTAEVPVYAVA
jgi:class 3 adenylate cyclase